MPTCPLLPRSSALMVSPTLGALTTAMALMAALAVYHPDTRVALLLVPAFDFSIAMGMKVRSQGAHNVWSR